MAEKECHFGDRALDLAAKAEDQLERWSALFEVQVCLAEESHKPFELKEFVAFTAALERLLKIKKLAATFSSEEQRGSKRAPIDLESIRDGFFPED